MPDVTQTAQTQQVPLWQRILNSPDQFGVRTNTPGQTPGGGLAQALTGTPQSQSGLLGALMNMIQFASARPGSASNTNKYQKALTDAGLPVEDTGVGDNQSH